MKPTLYLETTIPSYLVGGIAKDLLTAAHLEATKLWWADERDNYQLFVSSVVCDEINRGDPVLAQERRLLVEGFPQLDVTPEVVRLAQDIFALLQIPRSAEPDAFHLALACQYEIDYLMTWNMKHLASGRVRHALARFHDATGVAIPVICTPEELLDKEIES